MMKFSIVVPAYNEENYLERLLASLRNQSCDYEIIISDQESEDKTREIARKYGAKIVVGPRKGPAFGRNLGAEKSMGEYLVFVDADEKADSKLLEVLSKELDEENVIYLVRLEADSGKFLDKLMFEVYNVLNPVLVKYAPSLAVYSAQFICIRRDVFNRVGGFNTDFHLSEDRDLVVRALRYGGIKFIKKTFVRVSTRRLEKWGWPRFLLFHLYSHVYYTFFKKPIKREYEDIR